MGHLDKGGEEDPDGTGLGDGVEEGLKERLSRGEYAEGLCVERWLVGLFIKDRLHPHLVVEEGLHLLRRGYVERESADVVDGFLAFAKDCHEFEAEFSFHLAVGANSANHHSYDVVVEILQEIELLSETELVDEIV